MVNLVLPFEVVRIGGGPVAIQSRSNLPIIHIKSPCVGLDLVLFEIQERPSFR
jgi:hypothetical protein